MGFSELYSFLTRKNIGNLVYVGTSGNMCISWTRDYSMFQMGKLGFGTYFVRSMIENLGGWERSSDLSTNELVDEEIFEVLGRFYGIEIVNI